MARPLTALRDPSLLLPALLPAAAGPLTSHSVLRATPPRAQRTATPRPPRRRDVAPRATTGRAACPPCSLSTLFLTVCPVKTLPGSRVPTTANPLSSLPPPRLRAPVVMATPPPPSAPELEFGDRSSRARVSADCGTPPGAACTARTEAVLVLLCECTRVTWQMSSQGLQDRKIIIVSPPPQGCWPGAEELGSSPK